MEKKNKRVIELDYAKTIAIFFMVIIHVFEELSIFGIEDKLPSGFMENYVQFTAGPYAAPLFIFAMGFGSVFSRNQDPEKMFKRGLKLLAMGITLNLARDVLPRLLVCLISDTSPVWEVMRYQIFNIDVLHFAGLAYMLTALFKKLKVPYLALIPIAVLMQAVGNLISLHYTPEGFWELLFSYFIFTGDLSCFPLLTWYLSMAFGIVVGEEVKKFVGDADLEFSRAFWGCACLLTGFLSASDINGIDHRIYYALYDNFLYKQTFFNFLYNSLVIIMLLAVIHFVNRKKPIAYGFFNFCGTNLTTIYIIQWLIIGWISSFNGYLHIEPGFSGSIVLGIIIALISMGITKLLPPIKW